LVSHRGQVTARRFFIREPFQAPAGARGCSHKTWLRIWGGCQESSSAIFYEEVSAWHLDSEKYPDFNDFTLFTEWFATEIFDMVADAIDEPLTKGE
jgi:hypothetical protein